MDNLYEEIVKMIQDLDDPITENMLAMIKKDAPSTFLQEEREVRRQFEKSLRNHWQRPLDLLELFIILATKVGDDFSRQFRNEDARSDDYTFEALTRLHAKACQISHEVLTLLNSGLADGAHARWRSLHEIAVVSSLIGEHGQELAERYLRHDTVQRYKLVCEFQKYANRNNEEPIPQEALDSLKTERDKLVSRFGDEFKRDYGWAAEVTKSKNPTMREIEKQVRLDHVRPSYKQASDNVHPNSHGAYHRLGLGSDSNKVLLAGRSIVGLTYPGHSTAKSLTLTTITLLMTRPTLYNIAVSNILPKLGNEVGEAFLEAHQKVAALEIRESEP